MSKLSFSALAVAAFVATGSNAFATDYGSASSTAYTLGATASPSYAGGRSAPVVVQSADEPLVTGSVAPRKHTSSRHRLR